MTVQDCGGTLKLKRFVSAFKSFAKNFNATASIHLIWEWINVVFLFGMRQFAQKPFFASFLTTLIGCILICPISVSASLKDLTIPSSFGIIKEIHEPSDALDSPEIIQIQDAHCNYEAQKNLAHILEYLIKERKLRLIMVEGGSGDVGLESLRSLSDKSSREKVADQYLKEGKISGEEYLDIVSDYNIELYGIEDPNLYETNLDAFFVVEGYQQQGEKDLNAISGVVDALKTYMYNVKLRAFEAKKAEYVQKTIKLAEYLPYLQSVAGENFKLDDFPQLQSFQNSISLEKTLDFKQAESQRNIFIKEISKKVDQAAVKDLISQTQALKDRKIGAHEYYGFLRKIADGKIDIGRDYPALDGYMKYLAGARKVNPEALINEIGSLEDSIRETLFGTNDERQLYKIARGVDILTRFLNLDLTVNEYESLIASRQDYVTASWIPFLTDNCRKFRLPQRPQASAVIDEHFDELNQFYQVGLQREQAFIKNIKEKMSDSKEQIAVVIAGGFHTAGMSNLLRQNGFRYAVVTPAITKRGDPEVYLSVLRQGRAAEDFSPVVQIEE